MTTDTDTLDITKQVSNKLINTWVGASSSSCLVSCLFTISDRTAYTTAKKKTPKQTKKHPSAQVLFDSAANCCHGYVKESLGLLPMGEVGGANSGLLPFKGKGAETGCQTDMVRHQKPCLFG